MPRRSLIKAVSGRVRRSRSDAGDTDAGAGTPPPAAQLLPAPRGAIAGEGGKPMPWPSVGDSPPKGAGPPQLGIARSSASSAASSITFATLPTAAQRAEAAQNGSPAAARPQASRIQAPGAGPPPRPRPDSSGSPLAPPAAQRSQSGDSELAMLRSQLAAVTGALGPAQRGLSLEVAVRRLVTEVTQAHKGRTAAEEQLLVLREQGNALEQALAKQTQATQRAETGKEQAEERVKESQQQVEDLQQELAAAHSDSAGHMFQTKVAKAAAASAPSGGGSSGPSGSSTEHMQLELESLRGKVAAADDRLLAAQSAAEFAAQKTPSGRAAVDHRVAQLQQQVMHAQESCRYAEDRWDDVMGRLTEVLADQAAQQAMPHSPDVVSRQAGEGGLPTIAAVAAAAAERDAARSAELQQDIDALHEEVHTAQQAAGVAERKARGLQNELAAVREATQASAAAASHKAQELQNKLAKAQGDQAALQSQVDQARMGHKDANARAAQATATAPAAKLQQEVARLRQQLADAEAANAALQQAAAVALGRTSADSVGTPRRRLFVDRQAADAAAEQPNNEAHGEGGGGAAAAAQLRRQEGQVVELQSQLRATQAQVVELASWLTSNARLLMEQAAGKEGGGMPSAQQKHPGFHSDQVHLPATLHGIMAR